jgi:hypothetical protein
MTIRGSAVRLPQARVRKPMNDKKKVSQPIAAIRYDWD